MPSRIAEAGRPNAAKATVTLDASFFALLRAIATVHELPLRALIEETLLAALLSADIFSVDEREMFDSLARLSGLDLRDEARTRKLDKGILARERKKRRRRRTKKNPT